MGSPEQHPFFAMLADYHTQLHPFPFLAFGLGFAVMVLFFSSHPQKSRISLLILAFLWACHWVEVSPQSFSALRGFSAYWELCHIRCSSGLHKREPLPVKGVVHVVPLPLLREVDQA